MKTQINTYRFKILFAFFSIYFLWGTTFLAISYGLQGFPPFILSGIRFSIAGLLILIWLRFKGEKILPLRNWKRNILPATLILAAGVGLVSWSEQYLSSTEAAIVTASEPFWFILLDRKNRRNYFSNKLVLLGLTIGFAGLLLFLKDSLLSSSFSIPDGNLRRNAFLVLLAASVLWVIGALYSKKHPSPQSLFMNVGQQLTLGGIISLLVSAANGEWKKMNIQAVPHEAWMGLAYLIIFGSIVAYISYIWLMSQLPPAVVSTHTYINPIVAVLVGWAFLSEHISAVQLAGLIIILSAVLLTNLVQYKISRRNLVLLRRLRVVTLDRVLVFTLLRNPKIRRV